ncbi:MAG: DUF2125 domain-containing protein [Rhodobacteraceae bacterium]|jgi:hypothetical protein|nr:DUF2125 domain-containing protein [Paracoccaceae bacterium]
MNIFATRRQRALLSGCALAALLAGAPALAQVTPEDVWTSWKSTAENLGQTVAFGAETRAGNVLTVTAVTLTQPTDGPDIVFEMGDMSFADQGDGTVAITLAPSFTMSVTDRPQYGEAVDARMVMRLEGFELVASGEPAEITYDYGATAISFGIERFEVDGEPFDIVVDAVLGVVEGSYSYVGGDEPALYSDVAADSLKLDVRVIAPEDEGRLVINLAIDGFESTSNIERMDLLNALEGEDIGPALLEGLAIAGDIAYGPAEFGFEFEERGDRTAISGSAESGSGLMEMSADALAYSITGQGTTYTMSGSEIPLPEITVSYEDLALAFALPAAASAEPQDFSLLVRLVNLVLDEGVWSMADPGGALPHDPATLIVDIAGRANWTYGLFDPRTMGSDGFPGDLHALELRELVASAAGANVTGEGAFIFDNADRQSIPGIPRPMGEVTLTAVGLNGLMDKLVAMGLLPQDQAASAKFMLGLFASQVEGQEDTYTSKIELTPEGGIVANGQPLQ